jgi:DNA repair photolyase
MATLMKSTIEEKDRDGAAARTTMNGKPVFVVEAKSIINTKSGFEKKLLCDGYTFSMGDACAYRCAFCYVPSMYNKLERVRELKAKHGLEHEGMVVRRGRALEILESELVHPSGKLKYPDPHDNRVIYSSPAVDVAANMDLVRETIEACKLILTHTHWQIRLLSKSNLLPRVANGLIVGAFGGPNGYTEKCAKERVIYGVSTGTLDDGVATAFEQDTPKVSARLKSLHWLQDKGFRTFGMICPSLPQPDSIAYMKFAMDAAAAIRADKCEHVWAEVINVRGDSMVRTCSALGTAGHNQLATLLSDVSMDPVNWEAYNRATFLAHTKALAQWPGKLRFLTYTTKDSHPWWAERVNLGAVLL